MKKIILTGFVVQCLNGAIHGRLQSLPAHIRLAWKYSRQEDSSLFGPVDSDTYKSLITQWFKQFTVVNYDRNKITKLAHKAR